MREQTSPIHQEKDRIGGPGQIEGASPPIGRETIDALTFRFSVVRYIVSKVLSLAT